MGEEGQIFFIQEFQIIIVEGLGKNRKSPLEHSNNCFRQEPLMNGKIGGSTSR